MQTREGSACNVPRDCHESSRERQTQRALPHIRGMNIDLKTNLTWFLNRLKKCIAWKSQGFVVCQWSGESFALVLWFNKVSLMASSTLTKIPLKWCVCMCVYPCIWTVEDSKLFQDEQLRHKMKETPQRIKPPISLIIIAF